MQPCFPAFSWLFRCICRRPNWHANLFNIFNSVHLNFKTVDNCSHLCVCFSLTWHFWWATLKKYQNYTKNVLVAQCFLCISVHPHTCWCICYIFRARGYWSRTAKCWATTSGTLQIYSFYTHMTLSILCKQAVDRGQKSFRILAVFSPFHLRGISYKILPLLCTPLKKRAKGA